MAQQEIGERIARLEEQNKTATPLHEQFRVDIADLKTGQAEIKTILDLLVTNGQGHRKAKVLGVGFVLGLALMGGVVEVLRVIA